MMSILSSCGLVYTIHYYLIRHTMPRTPAKTKLNIPMNGQLSPTQAASQCYPGSINLQRESRARQRGAQ
eukprot:scaffold152736_cov21-Tisochrysis_lutea.AAC.1